MQQNNRSTIIAVIVGALLIVTAIVAYLTYTATTQEGKVAVKIVTVPSDATVQLNGANVSQGTVYLAPGAYKVAITKDGFADYQNTVTIDSSRATIAAGLSPVTPAAEEWADAHEADYINLDGEGSHASDKAGEAFQNDHPLTAKLPYENLIYSIGYRADPSDLTGNSVIITIDAPAGYRQAAVHQITQLGFNPADYKIEFNDYKDPFAS